MGSTERVQANAKKWIGQKNTNGCGIVMEVIAYRSSRDIDVRFSDGTEKHHVYLSGFRNGTITHPTINKQEQDVIARTGLSRKNGMGDLMKIIRYGGSLDIDVQFEDGSISKHKTYDSFLSGSIKRPTSYNKDMCEGRKIKATNGQIYEIVKYHNCHDIECLFEDGTVVHAKCVSGALNGSVVNPNHKRPSKYVGFVITASNGLRCKVMDVKDNVAYYIFEDGESGQMTVSSFRQGMIQHKHLGGRGDGLFHGAMLKNKAVFKDEGKVYYDCTFPDGTKDIITPQEIMERQGIKPVF